MSELYEVSKSSFRGGLLLFIGMLSSTIILAFTTILIARLLGPDDYGLYSIVLTVPSILITVSDLGISPALTRYSASLRRGDEEHRLIRLIEVGLISKTVFTIIISAIMFVMADPISSKILNRPGMGSLLRIASLYLIGQSLLTSLNSVFVGLDEAGKNSLLQNLQAIIKTIAAPTLIILGFGLTGALLGIGLGYIISTAIGMALLIAISLSNLKSKQVTPENPFSFAEGLNTLVSYGAPLYLSSLLFSFQTQVRNILLALHSSNESIGNFTTALNFTILISVLASPIATTLFPAFSKLSLKEHKESLETMFRMSVKYTSLIIIPAATGLALLSSEIVIILYGAQYQSAPKFLSIYSLSFFLTAIGMYITGSLLNSQGDTKTTLKVNILSLTVNLSLALYLIPRHGVIGLIASILTSQTVSTIYSLIKIKNMYQMSIDYNSSIRIIVSSLIPGSLVYIFLRSNLLSSPTVDLAISVIIFITSYMLLTPLTGAINLEDIENLDKLTSEISFLYPFARIFLELEEFILKANIGKFNR